MTKRKSWPDLTARQTVIIIKNGVWETEEPKAESDLT